MQNTKISNNKGYTIVELIVVIAILSLLVAIVMPNVMGYLQKSKAARVVLDCRAIETATNIYFVDTGEWPRLLGPNLTNKESYFLNNASVTGWKGPYLDKWPMNPFTTGSAIESSQNYQLDYKIDPNDGSQNLVVEICLSGLAADKIQETISTLDQTIDQGDGGVFGKFRWDINIQDRYPYWILAFNATNVRAVDGTLYTAN